MKKRITFISDTHTRHRNCENDLPGGDILIHSGDVMSSGYQWVELQDFLKWFSGLVVWTNTLTKSLLQAIMTDYLKMNPLMLPEWLENTQTLIIYKIHFVVLMD